MEIGDRRDHAPIYFLGPRVEFVAAPQASLDMSNGNLAIIGGQRADHSSRSITLDNHSIGPPAVECLA
jgi:hypothetical protein